ncbi:MAG: hypothetical protein ACRCUY_07590 [Thermoguttaceae bacterium]
MEYLFLILLIVSFLGLCLTANRSWRIPLEYTPFFTLSCMIGTMYIFGYIGQLQYNAYWLPVGFNPKATPHIPLLQTSIWLLFVGGLVGFVAYLWQERRNTKQLCATLLSPTIVVFVVVSIGLFVLTRFMWYASWDGVTHWAVVIRELWYYGGFQDLTSATGHRYYPIGCGIWGNYCVNILPFSVQNMLFAQALFQFAPIFLLLRGYTWKSPFLMIGIVCFPVFMTNVALTQAYFSLLSDVLLGCWFAGIIVLYYYSTCEKTTLRHQVIMLVPPLFVLFMLKEAAMVLAGIFYLYVFSNWTISWLAQKFFRTKYEGDSLLPSRFRCLSTIAIVIVFVCVPVLSKVSWDARISALQLKPAYMMSNSQVTTRLEAVFEGMQQEVPLSHWPSALVRGADRHKILRGASQSLTQQERDVAQMFKQMFDCNYACLTIRQQCIILLSCTLALFVVPMPGTRRFFSVLTIWLVVGAVFYWTSLLFAWMFAMTQYSGKAMIGGSERYPHSYTIAWGIILFSILCFNYRTNRKLKSLLVFFFFVIVLSALLLPRSFPSFSWMTKNQQSAIDRIENHFPDVLKSGNYAIYSNLPHVQTIQLKHHVRVIPTPNVVTVAKEPPSHSPLAEPCDEKFRAYNIDYYFMANDPPAAYWERNLSYFTDGEAAKNYTTFRVQKDAEGQPLLTALPESKIHD